MIMVCLYIAGLKKNKDRYESEMAELGSARETQSKEAEATGKITGLEKKIQYADIEKVLFSLIRNAACIVACLLSDLMEVQRFL